MIRVSPLEDSICLGLGSESFDSRSTVAALLGARRPSVNKVVSGLQRRRLIDVGYRWITMLDATALLAQAPRSTERPT